MNPIEQADAAVDHFIESSARQRYPRMLVWVPNANPNLVRDNLLRAFKKRGAKKAYNAGTKGDIIVETKSHRYWILFDTKKTFTLRGAQDCIVKLGS